MPAAKIEKTVYILGAGFSAPAGGPDQARLIERIFALPDTDAKTANAKKALEEFLVTEMSIDRAKKSEVNLEDIYTPIDRCLADGLSLRDKTPAQLQELRSKIEYLISLSIDRAFDERALGNPAGRDYVTSFAKYLVDLASVRAAKAKGATGISRRARYYYTESEPLAQDCGCKT